MLQYKISTLKFILSTYCSKYKERYILLIILILPNLGLAL